MEHLRTVKQLYATGILGLQMQMITGYFLNGEKIPRIAVIIVLIMMIIVMTAGCGSINRISEKNQITNNSVEDGQQSQVVLVGNKPCTYVLKSGAETDNGYYEVIPWPYEMYSSNSPWIHIGNIVYTDYETHTRNYLCNVPGCSHNTEDCTSFISYSNAIVLFSDKRQQHLYIMELGATDGEIYTNKDIGCLYVSDMSGANRTQLIKLDSLSAFSTTDPIFSDDNNLYVCIERFNGREIRKDLCKVSIDAGIIKDSIELSSGEMLLGNIGKNDFLVVNYDRFPVIEYETISFNNKEKTVIATADNDFSHLLTNNLLAQVIENDGKKELLVTNLNDDSVQVYSSLPQDSAGGIDIYDAHEDKLHWGYIDQTDEQNKVEYYVDLDNGEYTEKKLGFLSNGAWNTVLIISETNDKYMVTRDMYWTSLRLIDQEGMVHVYDYLAPQYALIRCDDYWANKEIYEDIRDYVSG